MQIGTMPEYRGQAIGQQLSLAIPPAFVHTVGADGFCLGKAEHPKERPGRQTRSARLRRAKRCRERAPLHSPERTPLEAPDRLLASPTHPTLPGPRRVGCVTPGGARRRAVRNRKVPQARPIERSVAVSRVSGEYDLTTEDDHLAG
jgi:hypothetical protein